MLKWDRQPRENVLLHIVQEIAVAASKVRDPAGEILPLAQRERC